MSTQNDNRTVLHLTEVMYVCGGNEINFFGHVRSNSSDNLFVALVMNLILNNYILIVI